MLDKLVVKSLFLILFISSLILANTVTDRRSIDNERQIKEIWQYIDDDMRHKSDYHNRMKRTNLDVETYYKMFSDKSNEDKVDKYITWAIQLIMGYLMAHGYIKKVRNGNSN